LLLKVKKLAKEVFFCSYHAVTPMGRLSMRLWTLAFAAAALLAAALWHLPAVAQRAAAPAVPSPTVARSATAPASATAQPAGARPAANSAAAPAAPALITFDEYRAFRLHYIAESQARLTRELTATDLTDAEKAGLERRKAYYDRQAAMPAGERDAMFRARFDQIDTDHDGTIDSAERAAWREKQRAHYRELAADRAQGATTQH
jgi:hypothetical protein